MHGKDPLRAVIPATDKSATNIRKNIQKRVKELDSKRINLEEDLELRNLIMQYQKKLFFALQKQPGINSKEAVYENDLYQEVNNAYLAIADLVVVSNPNFKKKILSNVNSAMTSGDEHLERLHQVITESEQQARDVVTEFITEHNAKLQAIFDESGISSAERVAKSSVAKGVFEDMLEDGFSFDPNNAENWMKFKDPDSPEGKKLSPAKREYIKFYNKNIKRFMGMMYNKKGDRYKSMFGNEENSVIQTGAPTWKEGYIPIIPKKATNQFRDSMLMRRGTEVTASSLLSSTKEVLSGIGKAFKSLSKPVEDGRLKNMEPWSLTELFLPQAESGPGRGSRETRNILGIDETNTVIKDRQSIEMDPATILTLLGIEATRKMYMGKAAFASEAIEAKLLGDKKKPGVDADETINMLKSLAQLRIHNKVDDEGKLAGVMDSAKKVISFSLFGGAVSQGIADTLMTNYQITAATIGNKMSEVLFKSEPKFRPKDIAFARKHMMSAWGSQLMTDFGMFNSSLGEFTESDYVGTRSKSMWQTKHMFAHFRNVLRKATQDVILAQMHKDGITEAVYYKDEEKGRYVYDETKDSRFYVYSPELAEKNIGNSEPPKENTEDWNKWIKWKAVQREMRREGGLTTEGRMRRPYTSRELTVMKQYAIRLFGALDNSEAFAAETSATWRMMLTFKKWVKHRVENFHSTKKDTWARAHWEEVRDESGMIIDYKMIKGDFEGLVQSVIGAWNELASNGFNRQTLAGMSEIRKENLGKLIGDILMGILLYSLYLWVKGQDWENEALASELRRGVNNALGDVITPYSVYYAVTSNAMPSIGMMGNVMKSGWTIIQNGFTGDLEKSLAAADQIGNLNGLYRLGKVLEIKDLVTD
jgi:hypothetical protein